MSFRVWRRTATSVIFAAVLVGAGCGSDRPVDSGAAELDVLSCEADRAKLLEILRSGLPTYDYNPAVDLTSLVESSNVVVAGTVESVARTVTESDPGEENGSWTVVSVQSVEVLHTTLDDRPVDAFSYYSSWPEGAGTDPLEAPVSVEGMDFVAFLDRWEAAPGELAAGVQGLVVDCTGGTAPSPVIAPLPSDAANLSLNELAEMVAMISASSTEAASSGVDGPLMRHVAPETPEGEAAEIAGVLELEGDCLYLSSELDDQRYPIVWPRSTRWDSSRSVVVLGNGDEVGVTDRVSGGGGYHNVARLEMSVSAEVAALASRCVDNTYGEVVVVNNHSDGIRRVETNEAAGAPAGVTVTPGTPIGETQTEPGPGEVKLWISNQSFADDPIGLSVALDGVTVVEQDFDVEGQHNWIAFDIEGLEPGVHTIDAKSETGAILTAEFTTKEDEPRWLVLDYWSYPDDPAGRHFTFAEFDEPIAFA